MFKLFQAMLINQQRPNSLLIIFSNQYDFNNYLPHLVVGLMIVLYLRVMNVNINEE